MLDDLKRIAQIDKSDALGTVLRQHAQLEYVYDLQQQRFPIENIVVAGMGGSALAAEISKSWPGYNKPFEVCRDYQIPGYVSQKTLFIASSYSGNTEETVTALQRAAEKRAHIICISSGGELKKIAEASGYVHVDLPSGLQPRFAVLYAIKALVTVLEYSGLVNMQEAEKELHSASEFLARHIESWAADVPTSKNVAKQLAEHLLGKTPIIYAGARLYPAAYKWKINFNENAKNTAWCGQLPEFNHNEFEGWTSHPVEKPFGVVNLLSNLEHPRVLQRFELTDKLLSGKMPKAFEVKAEGDTLLQQLLWTITLGDVVSIYLAILNNIDPTPVDHIEKFKVELK